MRVLRKSKRRSPTHESKGRCSHMETADGATGIASWECVTTNENDSKENPK